MDQLKLALEHKFWILAGLAILLPPIGWWAATDHLAQETDVRNKKIESAEKHIPNPKDVQNEKWIQGEKSIVQELTECMTESQERLFDHQKSVMKFPAYVQDAMDRLGIKYRGHLGANDDSLAAKKFFAETYVDDWKNTVSVIKPFKANTGEGLVLLPMEESNSRDAVSPLTRHYEVEQWRQTLGFTDDQMWDVEEDIWFLRALLQSIAKVNNGTTEIGNSRIKRVIQATLRGGDETDLATRKTPKTGSTTSGAGGAAKSGGMKVGGGFGGGGGGGSAESTYKKPKAFDADDEFGDDGTKSGTATDGRGKKSDSGVGEAKRWVQQTPKWNKRGFVLKLVMDEREIPALLTALSESPFPIEIRHVEHSAHDSVRGGSDLAQITSQMSDTTGSDGADASKEQQQQQQRIVEGLRMAFNMHYLADVTILGTLTIYNQPAATASKSASIAKSGASQPAAARTPSSNGTANSKTVPKGAGTAASATAPSKTLATGPAKTGPGSQPAKAGSPTAPTTGGAKVTPPGNGTRSTGK